MAVEIVNVLHTGTGAATSFLLWENIYRGHVFFSLVMMAMMVMVMVMVMQIVMCDSALVMMLG